MMKKNPTQWMVLLSGGIVLATVGLSFATETGNREKAFTSRGEIRLTIHDRGRKQVWCYRYNNKQLRIDCPDKIIPAPPVNLLDFSAGTLRILHPHNGTWEERSLKENTEGASFPFPGNHIPVSTPAGGMVPGGMPAFPQRPMPPMEGMDGESMVLVPQNQTNTLCGMTCTFYEIKLPRDEGTLSLWLSDDPTLSPFYLPAYRLSDSRDRMEWPEQVAQILRKQKLFPLSLTLQRKDSAQILAEWKVEFIKTDLEKKDQESLFKVPEGMHQLPPVRW